MLKIYYIILTIIVGLVVWLVADFARNSAEARDILSDISKTDVNTKGPGPEPPPSLPLHPGELPDIFRPRSEIIAPVAPPVTAAPRQNYILTGTIIEPGNPLAFIVNPTSNVEYNCRIGTRIDEWEVIEIIPEEVKLKSRTGDIMTLRVQKHWTSPKLERGSTPEIPPVIANIPGAEDIIKNIMAGTADEQVEKSIESVVGSLPPDYVKGLIKQFTGISEDDMPKDDAKLGEYAMNLFKVVQGKPVENTVQQSVENIVFAIRVNPDNSPISPQTVFKPGDRRIYACFPNQGSLQGMAKVITRWTNKATGSTLMLETKPINPQSSYNFVWREERQGWSAGEYEVELLHPQGLGKIASGKFNIVP